MIYCTACGWIPVDYEEQDRAEEGKACPSCGVGPLRDDAKPFEKPKETKPVLPVITFSHGDPPESGSYLVTDGEQIGIDTWWEFVRRVDGWAGRLPSDIGKPGGTRRWSKYENVIGWAPLVVKGKT